MLTFSFVIFGNCTSEIPSASMHLFWPLRAINTLQYWTFIRFSLYFCKNSAFKLHLTWSVIREIRHVIEWSQPYLLESSTCFERTGRVSWHAFSRSVRKNKALLNAETHLYRWLYKVKGTPDNTYYKSFNVLLN